MNKRPPATRNCNTCQNLHFLQIVGMRVRATHERRKISKRPQRRNPAAGWCLPRGHIVGIVPPRTRRRVLVRDEAHLDDTGDPCNSQGVAKSCVDHRGEHQRLSVSTERPSSDYNAKKFCELRWNPCTPHTLVRESRYAADGGQRQLDSRRVAGQMRTCPLRERKRPSIPPVHP